MPVAPPSGLPVDCVLSLTFLPLLLPHLLGLEVILLEADAAVVEGVSDVIWVGAIVQLV